MRFPADSETTFGGTWAGTHTPWIQSAAQPSDSEAPPPKTREKRPWDSPGAFSYAVRTMQMPLEGSLMVFLGYVLVLGLRYSTFGKMPP